MIGLLLALFLLVQIKLPIIGIGANFILSPIVAFIATSRVSPIFLIKVVFYVLPCLPFFSTLVFASDLLSALILISFSYSSVCLVSLLYFRFSRINEDMRYIISKNSAFVVSVYLFIQLFLYLSVFLFPVSESACAASVDNFSFSSLQCLVVSLSTGYEYIADSPIPRLSGFLSDPNNYAFCLASLYFLACSRKNDGRWEFCLSPMHGPPQVKAMKIMALISLIFSQSRSLLLILILAFALPKTILFFRSLVLKRSIVYLVLVCSILSLSLLLLFPGISFFELISSRLEFGESRASLYLFGWNEYLGSASDNAFLFGQGLSLENPPLISFSMLDFEIAPHNTFFYIFMVSGLFGLILFIAPLLGFGFLFPFVRPALLFFCAAMCSVDLVFNPFFFLVYFFISFFVRSSSAT